MGLLRLILILIIGWLIWTALRPMFHSRPKSTKTKSPGEVENMVRCDYCGLNLPEREAIYEDNHYYCSEAHRQRSNQ